MAVTAIPVPPSRSLSSRPRRLVASADASLPRAATKARLLVSIASLWCLVFFGIISLSLPPRIDEESNLTFSLHHQSGLIDHLNTTVTKKVKNKLIRRSVAEIRESLASPDAKEQAFKDESIDASATRDGEFQVGNESEPVTYHKWSDSLIWPCVNVESVLKPRATSDSHVEPRFLRALYLHNWTLDLGSDAYVAQTYTASMLQILHTAKSSFSRSLERSIPLEGKDYRVNPNKLNVYELVGIRIQIDNVTSRLEPAVDESYSIHIPHPEATSSRHSHDHWIHIHAATVYGARHGLETMKQLFNFGWVEKENDEAATPIALFTLRNATLYVKDSPAYPFRGLLIDTARHFLPLGLIHRNLQVMAANKLNVLHWHMSDTESWPFQSTTFPELSKKGAHCDECIYTRGDVKRVITEAALLGIRVIVEFDVPGHSQAIGRSYPELMTKSLSGQLSEPLDVTETAVHQFVERLYIEAAGLFPDDWMHLGGDEVFLGHWYNSTKIQRWMTGRGISTVVELWQYFEIEAIAKVEKQGKRAIIWHDSFEAGAMLPPSTILDIWMLRNMEESTYRATNAGHDVVLSACWYLDHLDPDWWSFYQCNPRNFVIAGSLKLSDEQISRILGGHSSMWGELVDATNFFERVWPRASATAEVLWAGGIGTDDTTIQDAVRRRLERFRCWIIQQFDIAASPISIQHCELPSRFHSSEMS